MYLANLGDLCAYHFNFKLECDLNNLFIYIFLLVFISASFQICSLMCFAISSLHSVINYISCFQFMI